MPLKIHVIIFYVMTLCSSAGAYETVGETYYFLLQGILLAVVGSHILHAVVSGWM
jgi:hypothetical protein